MIPAINCHSEEAACTSPCHSEEAACGRRENLLFAESRLQILAVQSRDMIDGDVLRALHLAGAGVRAVAETEFVHLGDHRAGAAGGFRLALREQGEGADARSHE